MRRRPNISLPARNRPSAQLSQILLSGCMTFLGSSLDLHLKRDSQSISRSDKSAAGGGTLMYGRRDDRRSRIRAVGVPALARSLVGAAPFALDSTSESGRRGRSQWQLNGAETPAPAIIRSFRAISDVASAYNRSCGPANAARNNRMPTNFPRFAGSTRKCVPTAPEMTSPLKSIGFGTRPKKPTIRPPFSSKTKDRMFVSPCGWLRKMSNRF